MSVKAKPRVKRPTPKKSTKSAFDPTAKFHADVEKSLPDVLRYVRQKLKLTQQELGDILGVSAITISQLELRRRSARQPMILFYALNHLLEREPED